MKSLPKDLTTFKPLHDMLIGATRARLLETGLSFKIFDYLEQGSYRTDAEVAAQMGTHPVNTRHFLDSLTTIGLVEKRRGSYRNLHATEKFLKTTSEYYVGPLFTMIREMSVSSLDNIEELVRKGPCPLNEQEDIGSESTWVDGARAGALWVYGEMGCRIAEIIANLPGFGGFDKMLDLGGGHGIFTLYTVEAHPTMRGVVFDQPAVVEVAREFVGKYSMAERVTVMGGNYQVDDFGQDYDLIWASATLNFAKANLDQMLTRIYKALIPGGYFISFQDGMTHEQTQPDTMLEWLGSVMTTGRDLRMERGEIAETMLRCGFRSVHSRSLDTPMGMMDLDIARK